MLLAKGKLQTYAGHYMHPFCQEADFWLNDTVSKYVSKYMIYIAPVLEESGRVVRDILGKVGSCSEWGRLTESKMSLDDVWK